MPEKRSVPSATTLILIAIAGLAPGGCATLNEPAPSLVPTKFKTESGPYAVYSNFAIPADSPAIHSLQALENDIERNLGVRVQADRPPIEVYILNDRESFNHFLKFYYPELPPRRAFFLAQGTQRVVFTYLGDRLEEDLRHEATHALLNVAYGDLPLWLDEGLAEYFEGPGGGRGVNREHLGRLPRDLSAGWKPDLARLEMLRTVGQMTPRDYRESWAWIHYLLTGSNAGKTILLAYLADLRTDPASAPLSTRLAQTDNAAPAQMLAHIEQVRAQPLPDPTVRLQDSPAEPERKPSARRGFFSRIKSFFAL